MKSAKALVLSMTIALLVPFTARAEHPLTIAEIVATSGGEFDRDRNDFDILLNAVLAADLADVLGDPHADFTVFAPNDRAFIRLAREFGYTNGGEEAAFNTIVTALTGLGGGDPIPVLTNVLLYHVSPEAKALHEVLDLPIIETALEGQTIAPVWRRLLDNEPDLRDPRVLRSRADIAAANGVIHTINRVLIPIDIANTDPASLSTITGLVAASGGTFDDERDDFDILLNAVIAAGLADALDNPADTLTVLAPTDAAFIRTARAAGFHGHDEAGAFQFIVETLTHIGEGDPIPPLTSLLLYHVVPEALTLKDVLETEAVSTLLDDAAIYPNPANRTLGDYDEDFRDPRLQVRLSNIRASNGFIHAISRVLIPVDVSEL
ncbi:MAG: fasciclin domain-containing protein [Pseudomonadota bacterium]